MNLCLTCDNEADEGRVYCVACQVVKDDRLFGAKTDHRRLCGTCGQVSVFKGENAMVIMCVGCGMRHELDSK